MVVVVFPQWSDERSMTELIRWMDGSSSRSSTSMRRSLARMLLLMTHSRDEST